MKGQFPWIGRSRGSAGGMTTSKINDKNVMRAKAFEVTNPKTAAQVMQRDFFKEVQEVCASVTEDQLRSLFGVKPKTMTRRNALSKQIAAAYTITDGVKSVNLSKLLAIGNGSKVNTPIGDIDQGVVTFSEDLNPQMFNTNNNIHGNVILVVFDEDNHRILLINTAMEIGDCDTNTYDFTDFVENFSGYCYFTCDEDGQYVYDRGFGSFIIKTRAE